MKSVLQNVKSGEVSVEEIPTPVLKPGHVLVRNAFSLVSAGTEKAVLEFSQAGYLKKARLRPDLFRKVMNKARNDGLLETYKVVSRLIEQKIQLGYSCAGTVIAVGSEITDLAAGDRVACGGLFAATHSEVVAVARNLVVPVPEGVDLAEASFVTVGAIALQGVRLADLALSENVVVYGLGLVGMITAQMALAAGCRVMGVDIDPRKMARATALGVQAFPADENLEAAILRATGGFGADTVMLCAATKSNEPIERIPGMMRQKGRVVIVGDVPINVPRRAYYDKEIDIRISRSYGPGRYDLSYEEGGLDYPYAYVRWTENRNMAAVMDLLGRKRLRFDALITHRVPIAEALRAYDVIEGKVAEPYLGIVIHYPETATAGADARVVRQPEVAGRSAQAVRMGVIGAGNFGKAFLLPAFARQKDLRFVGICTASGVSAASMARQYGMSFASSDPDEIFRNAEINAVMIATRHDAHAGYVLKALEADKAVYVEKPLATNAADLQAIRALIERKQKEGRQPFLMVGFNRRFSPLAATLKQVFAERKAPLSIVYRVNAGFVAAGEWVQDPQQGGGRVIGEVCHFIDFLTFLAGESPAGLTATALQEAGKPVPDVLTITLDFPGGSVGTIHYLANGDPSMAKEQIEVFGGKACARLQNFRKLEIFGARAKGKTHFWNQVKGFNEEAAAFVDALRAGRHSPIPFSELEATTRATFAVAEALASRGRVGL